MPATSTTPVTHTSVTGPAKRSRARRAGESAYGALLLARLIFVWLLVALLVAAGVWTSWDTVEHAMLSEPADRGTVTLRACDSDACAGPYDPSASGDGIRPLDEVVLRQSIGLEEGETLSVALRPGTHEVVRTELAGALYAWLPLTGALLLGAVVIAGGLRMYRTAWATAGIALVALAATFALW
jgi:hypothetical protein